MLRNLTINDFDKYIQLLQHFRPSEKIATRQMFEDFINSYNITVWVYEDIESGKLIGTVTIMYEHKLLFGGCIVGHIEDVCVHPDYRGQGIGSLLIQHVITEAQQKNCYKIVLHCAKEVLPFYLANGFEERGVGCSMLLPMVKE